MSDIVERLRDLETAAMSPERRQIIVEAADEIEQLRALLRAIMEDTSDGQESMSDDIRGRIERALEPKP